MKTIEENSESFETKISNVLNHLKTNHQITSWEAITKYGCSRLASVIYVLKERGFSITTEMVYNKPSRYAIYHFHGERKL
jgi:hypothetical protein